MGELMQRAGLGASPERLAPLAKREASDVPRLLTGPPPPDVEWRDATIAGPGGPLAVRVYRPTGLQGALPCLLYLHGGGWVMGGLAASHSICAWLTSDARVAVASVAYRLAPQAPFPAALDDAEAALRWVAGELSFDPAALGVAGDSAGGNLAAALAIRVRDHGGPALRLQVLLYPALDATLSSASMRTYAGPGLKASDMRAFTSHYAGDALRTDPELSPAHLADARGLPPAVVVTAGFDCLHDEGAEYAERLRQAGVPVVHLERLDAPHGFLSVPRLHPPARDVLREVAGSCRALLVERVR
jgi:acetyl esterase